MAFAWKSANISYLQYSQICAAALRNVVKADLKIAVSKRQSNPFKVSEWKAGQIVDT
ncbi:hypothetical protein BJ085DRAFT_34712, partial [Dimargaris cristalligena]